MTKRLTTVFAALAAVVFLALAAGPLSADVYLKYKRHTDPVTVMGQTQPAEEVETVIWIGKNKARFDTGEEVSTIVLPDKKIMYMLNHENMTYAEMPMDLEKAIDEAIEKEGGEEAKGFAKMMKGLAKGMMKFDVNVTETNETKKIGKWNCRKYIAEVNMPMGSSTSEIWATEEIKVDPRLYYAAANAMMASMEGFENLVKEYQKIKGMAVMTISKGKAMESEVKTTEELLEYEEKSAPAGTYDIPKGYKKTKGFMED